MIMDQVRGGTSSRPAILEAMAPARVPILIVMLSDNLTVSFRIIFDIELNQYYKLV